MPMVKSARINLSQFVRSCPFALNLSINKKLARQMSTKKSVESYDDEWKKRFAEAHNLVEAQNKKKDRKLMRDVAVVLSAMFIGSFWGIWLCDGEYPFLAGIFGSGIGGSMAMLCVTEPWILIGAGSTLAVTGISIGLYALYKKHISGKK